MRVRHLLRRSRLRPEWVVMILRHAVGPMYFALQIAGSSALVASALTAVVKVAGARYEWCGAPLAHHTHNQSVPRLGGLAVYAAILVTFLITLPIIGAGLLHAVLPILLGALPIFLIGVFDDLRHASPRTKIAAQLFGAAICLATNWSFGTHLPLAEMGLFFGWIVLTTNSFNLIDGLDGLASGSAVVIGSALAVINLLGGRFALGVLSIMIVAACLGFLPFNFRKRVFLGDCGSLTIGFLLAAIAFESAHSSRSAFGAVALFGYPLTETFFTLVRRWLEGHGLLRPDREHFHHKLRHAGLSVLQSSGTLILVALAFASVGFMAELGASRWLCLAGGTVLFAVIGSTFGYFGKRSLVRLRRRIAEISRSEEAELPDISGYVPNK
jgi:UDP-GlcNAc:undecaprenyl-phosphate GlcNAc-1-phosphate transferase